MCVRFNEPLFLKPWLVFSQLAEFSHKPNSTTWDYLSVNDTLHFTKKTFCCWAKCFLPPFSRGLPFSVCTCACVCLEMGLQAAYASINLLLCVSSLCGQAYAMRRKSKPNWTTNLKSIKSEKWDQRSEIFTKLKRSKATTLKMYPNH